jgi:broad specificity phosphatase PhoE
MDYCTIYLARHGETDWNNEQRIQGHTDIALNQKGITQAQELAQHLKEIHFDAAFSSDLLRAKRTAEIIAEERKLVITTTELLREQCFGEFEGILIDEYRERAKAQLDKLAALKKDQEKMNFKINETAESRSESASRALLFIREISIAYSNMTILMVCHGALMRNILMTLGVDTYANLDYGKVEIGNTAYIKMRCDGVDFFVDVVHKITGIKHFESS